MIKKEIDSKGVILFVKSKPIVTFDDMLIGLQYLSSSDLPKKIRICEDARDSEVTFSVDDIHILLKEVEKVVKKYSLVKHAVIHNSPKNTAYTMIFSNNYQYDNYKLKVFSTKEAAMEWLNSK